MRILFWQEPFWPNVGGMQTIAQHLLAELHRRGQEVTVVTRRDSSDLPHRSRWCGLDVVRLPFFQALEGGRLAEISELRREIAEILRAVQPDVIHLNGLGPSTLFCLEAQRRTGAPLLVALHSSNTLSAAPATLARQTLARADWVVACSRALLDQAAAAEPAIATRSSVVHNAVPAPACGPPRLPPEPRVLCLGTLAPHKGFDLAVRAMPDLLPRFGALRLIVAGDGPGRADLERLAASLGVRDAVDFTGLVPHDEVPAVIGDATLVAVPSRRESFGLIAVEAALLRRPVVAARIGGLPEVVVDGETGVLVEPDSSNALARGLGILLAQPELAARMGAAAQRRAQREFAPGPHAAAYEALYCRIVAQRRSAAAREANG